MNKNLRETHKRSIGKVITWRIAQIIIQLTTGYLTSGSFNTALKLAGFNAIFFTILYWAHERSWNSFCWDKLPNKSFLFIERHRRTIVKCITWRILAIVGLSFTSYIITKSVITMAMFTSMTILINIIVYWLHERVWNIVRWGKIKK
jgi:uncharacterized membrane protein